MTALRTGIRLGAGALVAGAGFLVSRGRIHLDLGWGRSTHALGPIIETIDAPRDLVFEHVSTPYLGRAPAEVREKIAVLERADDTVVAEHRTPLPWLDAITVERVRFLPPDRITFRLLRGPVPEVTEEFLLEEADGGTRFTYTGELSADLWWLGRWWGGRIVAPTWEGVVARSIAEIKAATEARAAARRRRTADGAREDQDMAEG